MAENKTGPGLRALGMLAIIGLIGFVVISIGRLIILKAPKVNVSCCMIVGASIMWFMLTWVCFNPPDMNKNHIRKGQPTYDYEITGTELSFSKVPIKPFLIEWRSGSDNWILDKDGNTTLLDNGSVLTRTDVINVVGMVDGKNNKFKLSSASDKKICYDYRALINIFGDDGDRVAPTRDEFWVGHGFYHDGPDQYAFVEKPCNALHWEKYFMTGCYIAAIFGGLVFLGAVLE